MTLKEYQDKAMSTCMDSSKNPLYMLFMLGEEVGELQGKFSKAIRKGWISFDANQIKVHFDKCELDEYKEWLDLVKKELGDCLWGIAGVAEVFSWSLEEVAQMNLDKLASRNQRGVIDGNGDNR